MMLTRMVAVGQQGDYFIEFQEFSRADGMRGNAPLSVVEDSSGFVWVSTWDGINRFDGQQFTFYRKQDLGIEATSDLRLHTDVRQMIWVFGGQQTYNRVHGVDGYLNGQISIFNPYTHVYYTFDDYFPQAPFCDYDVFNLNHQGEILYVHLMDGSTYRYDGRFRLMLRSPDGKPAAQALMTQANEFYLAQGHQLTFIDVASAKSSKELFPFAIYKMKAWGDYGVLLSGPISRRLAQWSVWVKRGVDPAAPIEVEGAPVSLAKTALLNVDTEGNAWLNEKNRVFVLGLSPEGRPVLHYQSALSELAFSAHYQSFSSGKSLWMARPGFIAFVRLRKNVFSCYLNDQLTSIRGMAELPGKKLVAATYIGGREIDLSTGKENRTFPEIKTGGYYLHRSGDSLWIGLHRNSVKKYEPGRDSLLDFPLKLEGAVGGAEALIPYTDAYNKVWIALGAGLGLLRPGDKKVSVVSLEPAFRSLHRISIRQFVPAPEGLWLATSKGIFLIDPKEEKILATYTTPEGEDVFYLRPDVRGNFWIALYRGNLLYWDRKANTFTSYPLYSPRLDNGLHAVLPDGRGNYWLPTNNGLYRFNPELEKVAAFYTADGLPDDEFNAHSWLTLSDGRLALGGINGIVVFDPDDLTSFTGDVSRTRIKDIYTYGPQTGATENRIAELMETGALRLPHNRRKLEINFCLVHPTLRHRLYYYRLNPATDNEPWIPLESGHLLLSELGYGENVIEVMTRAEMQLPHNGIVRMLATVDYPWYLRWWALTLYGIALILSMGAYIQRRLKAQLLANRRLEAEVAARTQQLYEDKLLIEEQNASLSRLNTFKDRMMGMIGHEIRNPMLSLFGMAEKLTFLVRKQRWDDIEKISGLIDSQLLELRHLLDNLVQWAQSMPGGEMTPAHVDLCEIIAVEWKQLAGAAAAKHIALHESYGSSGCLIVAMPQAVSVVMRNVLHNAIKFSPPGNNIVIALETTSESQARLIIKNAGPGFPQQVIDKLADPHFFYSSKGSAGEPGTGLGLRLCAELMQRNNGSIAIENPETGGAKITLSFLMKK